MVEQRNDHFTALAILLPPRHAQLVVYPRRAHRLWRENDNKDIAVGQLFGDVVPPEVAALESADGVIPDLIMPAEAVVQIRCQFVAERIIGAAVADEDARRVGWLLWAHDWSNRLDVVLQRGRHG